MGISTSQVDEIESLDSLQIESMRLIGPINLNLCPSKRRLSPLHRERILKTITHISPLKNLTPSPHFCRRMAQRGISWCDVEFALENGWIRFSHGATVCWIDDRALKMAERGRGLERLRGLYLVISDEGVIITAAWSRRLTKKRGFKDLAS